MSRPQSRPTCRAASASAATNGGIDVPQKGTSLRQKAQIAGSNYQSAAGRHSRPTGLAIAATRGGLPDAVPRCLHDLSCHLLNYFGGGYVAGDARSVVRLPTRRVRFRRRVCALCWCPRAALRARPRESPLQSMPDEFRCAPMSAMVRTPGRASTNGLWRLCLRPHPQK